MSIKDFTLRSGILCLFLFSGNSHAIPLLTGLAYSGDVSNYDVRFINTDGANESEAGSGEAAVLAHALPWNFSGISIGELRDNYFGQFNLFQGFYPAFAFFLQDKGLEKFITWTPTYNDDGIFGNFAGMEGDDVAIAEFFATLGIDIEDWRMVVENPHVPGHHHVTAPIPDSPAVVRAGQRKECVQGHREFSRKSEWRDNDCFEGVGGLAGLAGRGRSQPTSRLSGSDAGLNPGSNAGIPGVIGAGGGGMIPGIPADGGDNGSENGSVGGGGGDGSAPDTDTDTDTGDGEAGGGGSGVRPLPEPATLILLLLGLACMRYTRSRIKCG